MAGTSGEPSLRTGLVDLVDTVIKVADHLEELVPHPSRYRYGSDNVRHGRFTVSSPSWHARAAGLVLELHAMARDIEAEFRLRASGSKQPRGSSDRNTVLALEAITKLAEAVDDQMVRDASSRLGRWCQRGRTALDEVEELHHLPRQPGQPEPRCPWCQFMTLRYQPLAGIVRCVNPGCRDEEQRRPRAVVSIGAYTGELQLVWQDSTAGLPV